MALSSVRFTPAPTSSRKTDPGVDHHRAAELEQLLLAAREVAGTLVGDVADLEEGDDVVGAGAHLGLAGGTRPGWNHASQSTSPMRRRHHHQVVAHAQRRELVRDLEGAQQALVEQRAG